MNRFWLYFLLMLCCSLANAQEGIVEEFTIHGNKKLKTSFIKLISDLHVDSPLDSTMLEVDIIRLKRLPAVRHAYYQVIPSFDNYEVRYYIEEHITINPQLNIYTTNDDEFAFRIGLYEFNTLGRNIAFGGFYQRDVFDSYGVNLRAPFLLNNKLGVAMNVQRLTTQEPVFLDEGTADYKYSNTSFEVLGLYALNLKHRVEAGVNLFNEKYEYLAGATACRGSSRIQCR